MFTEKVCRLQLDFNARVCGGNTRVHHLYYYNAVHGQALSTLIRSLRNKTKSIVLFGVGLHDELNDISIINKYIQPSVGVLSETNQTAAWPHLVWLSHHAPGLLKSPLLLAQESEGVQRFNEKIEHYLTKSKIPFLNFYNLTEGTFSFDGSHYGFGINLSKVQILLNYIQEMQRRGRW
jgi:hypothetical protein